MGLLASAGFAIASGLNIVIVMSGLGILLSEFVHILAYLKWAGVAFLLYLAVKAFRATASNGSQKSTPKRSHVFGFAVLVSLTNPKVLLGNIMILPLFLDPSLPFLSQAIVITGTATVLSFCIYSTYALVASRFISNLKSKTANRVVGSIYLGAGAALASLNK